MSRKRRREAADDLVPRRRWGLAERGGVGGHRGEVGAKEGWEGGRPSRVVGAVVTCVLGRLSSARV